jgi:L-seryl-tRNA(Ser) seleniumtransferase
MSIYKRFGVEPVINVVGAWTMFGGALMEKEALRAMEEAAKEAVRLDELQAAASKVIAEITHAEAGFVTSGAAAGMTLSTAACIAGFDVKKMNRLPDTTGIPNEIIIPWPHISAYNHAFRAAGAKLVKVGTVSAFRPLSEAYMISRGDIETAITENTVAIAYTARQDGYPPLEEVAEIGHKYNIPVIVDAAPQVPPIENLHRFIDLGADLVCISGGKGICGPQASGILCGRRDLIASAVVQMLDISGSFETWNPPVSLIPKEKFSDRPERGVGRGMKVSKEAIIGLLVALENFTENKLARRTEHLRQLLEGIRMRLESVTGLEMTITEDRNVYPSLQIKIDKQIAGKSAAEISQKLKDGKPSIFVGDMYLQQGVVSINSINIDEKIASIVGERLYTVFTGHHDS